MPNKAPERPGVADRVRRSEAGRSTPVIDEVDAKDEH